MKKIITSLFLLSFSLSSFAQLHCEANRMKQFGDFLIGIDFTNNIKFDDNGKAEDYLLTNYLNFKGRGSYEGIQNDHAYWLKAKTECNEKECSLVGNIDYTTVMHDGDFSTGSATAIGDYSYKVNIKEGESKYFDIKDDFILKIECE